MARKPGIRILSFIAVAVTVTLYLELAPVPAASSNVAFSNQALAASLNGAEPSGADRFAFSSDGNLLASATDDGHIALLSLLSGRQRLIGPAPFSASVADLSFSPDGKTLASASEDAITLWDVRTGQERTVLGSTASVNVTDIAFSPDGKLLVGVADAARILVWDIATGFQLWTLPANDSDLGIAFSPNGQMLASSGKAKGITLWDMATGQELLKKDGAVTPVSFSPNGLSVASGDANSDITFYSPAIPDAACSDDPGLCSADLVDAPCDRRL